MKISLNLLPKKRINEQAIKRKKIAQKISILILLVFLIFNFFLFATSLFFHKSTNDTLSRIATIEENIANFKQKEELYLSYEKKLDFLSKIILRPIKVEDFLYFLQTVSFTDIFINKITFSQDGTVILSIQSESLSNLDLFLKKIMEEESLGRIKEIKIISSTKNNEINNNFNILLGFVFKGIK